MTMGSKGTGVQKKYKKKRSVQKNKWQKYVHTSQTACQGGMDLTLVVITMSDEWCFDE